MKLATIQASAIKSTFEVLKDILNDVNVYFKPDGLYVTTLDTARTSLVDMFLSGDNFEEYSCETEIVAGINVTNTFKLLKSITNNDVLMMSIDSREYMNIEIHNETKKTCTKFALKLLDINENQIEVPDMNMTTVTPMPSIDFQRICRDMYNIGTDIEITRNGTAFRLKCEGDFANQETEIQRMIEIVLFEMHGLTVDKVLSDRLAFKNEIITSNNVGKVNNSGPRIGGAVLTGDVRDFATRDVKYGGLGIQPFTSMIGYQIEGQYVGTENFSALVEGIINISGLEQSQFIPSFSLLNGFRFGKGNYEFAFGPRFGISSTSYG